MMLAQIVKEVVGEVGAVEITAEITKNIHMSIRKI